MIYIQSGRIRITVSSGHHFQIFKSLKNKILLIKNLICLFKGINVREKAKAVVALLKDDERLRNERVRALKAKERFALPTAGIGSNTVVSVV